MISNNKKSLITGKHLLPHQKHFLSKNNCTVNNLMIKNEDVSTNYKVQCHRSTMFGTSFNPIRISESHQSHEPKFLHIIKNNPNLLFKITPLGSRPNRVVTLIDYDEDFNGIFWYIDFIDDTNIRHKIYEYERNLIMINDPIIKKRRK